MPYKLNPSDVSRNLRIAILESEILTTIATMMRITIHVNVMKSAPIKPEVSAILSKMHELRSHLENIKAFTILLWNLKAIAEGFFIQVSARSEEISKQIIGWENDPPLRGDLESKQKCLKNRHSRPALAGARAGEDKNWLRPPAVSPAWQRNGVIDLPRLLKPISPKKF